MFAPRVTRGIVRRGLTIVDLVTWLIMLALLIGILLPALSRARQTARRSACAANLRGVGQAMMIYSSDHDGQLPQHYFEAAKNPGVPGDHGVSWVGTMGSSATLAITQQTSATVSPRRGHPSRSLFLLISLGMATPPMFICPASGDAQDDLRNGEAGMRIASQPGVNRFDFQGYTSLSYGYQLPFGPAARPSVRLDARMAIGADKSPYYTTGGSGLEGTGTTRDARSALEPPAPWAGKSAEALRALSLNEWRSFNSRNHRGEGQNILFVDSHVEFAKRPIQGVNDDNLYTLQNSASDPQAALIGVVPSASQTLGPGVETDSFIVP